MSAVYRVHPHPARPRCSNVIKNASVDPEAYRFLADFTVNYVDIDPAGKTWQIHLTGLCDHREREDPRRAGPARART